MLQVLMVALGGALGGMARYFVSGFVGRRAGETFPWGTMTVNVSGALAIGIIASVVEAGVLAASGVWPFFVTGFLGCYTTVSSFSLQTLALAQNDEWKHATGNVLLSVVLCIVAAALGFAGGTMLFTGGAAL